MQLIPGHPHDDPQVQRGGSKVASAPGCWQTSSRLTSGLGAMSVPMGAKILQQGCHDASPADAPGSLNSAFQLPTSQTTCAGARVGHRIRMRQYPPAPIITHGAGAIETP